MTGAIATRTLARGTQVLLFMTAAATASAFEIRQVHSDHLGTPKAVTDEAGQVVWRSDHTPFGQVIETVVDEQLQVRFPGQFEDGESALYYNYRRYYDPSIGRYTQSDPIGLDGGLNNYLYASGNPIGFIDPEGTNPFYGAAAASAAVVGGSLLRSCLLGRLSRKLCKELGKCITNPRTCKRRFCRVARSRTFYHPFCDVPGCGRAEGVASRNLKLASAQLCLALRQFVTNVCYDGKADAEHRRQEDVARAKIKACFGCELK